MNAVHKDSVHRPDQGEGHGPFSAVMESVGEAAVHSPNQLSTPFMVWPPFQPIDRRV
jgi:hypothetical protein